MSTPHILLVLLIEVLVFAVVAAIGFHRAYRDARARSAEIIAIARSYAERVAVFVTRRPDLSRDPEVRRALERERAARAAHLDDVFRRAGVDGVACQTGEPYRRALLQFFEQRLRRVRPAEPTGG